MRNLNKLKKHLRDAAAKEKTILKQKKEEADKRRRLNMGSPSGAAVGGETSKDKEVDDSEDVLPSRRARVAHAAGDAGARPALSG